jgi:hypothetical protein
MMIKQCNYQKRENILMKIVAMEMKLRRADRNADTDAHPFSFRLQSHSGIFFFAEN